MIEGCHYFKNRQVFSNGTSMVYTKINGDLLNGISTFEVSFGNIYFNCEDYVNVIFKLGDKLEIDYDNSKVKISSVLNDDKKIVIDELVKSIYVNRDEVASAYEFGKKEVKNNIKKLLPNS